MTSVEQLEYTEVELRSITHNLLVEWYDREVDLGREQYFEGKDKRSKQSVEVPEDRIRDADILAQAKKDRPWLWNTRTTREYVAYNAKGEEIKLTEPVTIVDTFGPGPRESKNSPTTKAPDGRHYIGDVKATERDVSRVRARIAYMKRLNMSIQHLDHFAPTYLIVLRWYYGGLTVEQIAKRLTKVTKSEFKKGKIEKIYEASLTWVMGCVAENPIWREYLPEFREALKENHAERRRE